MQVSGSIRIPFVVNGVDGIVFSVPSNLIFSPKDLEQTILVGAWRDGESLLSDSTQIKLPESPANGVVGVSGKGFDEYRRYAIVISRASLDYIFNWDADIVLSIEGVDYTFTIAVRSVFDGEKGDKGEQGEQGEQGTPGSPGVDATIYTMEVSASAITYYPARKAYSPESVTFSGYKTEGDVTTAIDEGTWWYVLQESASGGSVSEWRQGTSIEVAPETSALIASRITVTMCKSQNQSDAYDGCSKTVTVNTSCQPRILVWEDQEEGFQFECGAVGDTYIDTVIYGGDGTSTIQKNMFQCLKTHKKSGDTAPPESATQNEYWVRVTWYDTVATNLILANLAYINNLVAGDVYMETEDGKTAIWINPSLAGMLVRKVSDLAKTGRENQTVEDWSKPTTAFTAQELPDMEALYERKEFSGEREDGWLTGAENATSIETEWTSEGLIGRVILTGVLISGGRVSLSVDSNIRVTIDEGNGTRFERSQINLEMRCATSVEDFTTGNYRTLWTWTAEGTGVNGESVTREKNAKVDLTFDTETEDLYVRLYETYIISRAGSCIAVEGSFSVSGYSEKPCFVSRYTAGGLFVGQSSNNCLRVGMNTASEAQHTLLAGGNGVDLTQEGSFQYQFGKKMPFGYALFAGDITTNGSSLFAEYWTFDDASLDSLEHKDIGQYVINLPSMWRTKYGFDFSSGRDLCVTAIARNTSAGYVMVTGEMNGEITINAFGADGQATDLSFTMRIDYMPKNKAMLSHNYKEAVVTLDSILQVQESGSSTKKVYFSYTVTLNDFSTVVPSYFEIDGVKYEVVSDSGYYVDVPAYSGNYWSSKLVCTYELHSADGDINGEIASSNLLVWNGTDFSIR